MTQEEKELIAKFNENFTAKATSLASQDVHANENGTIEYDNEEVFGDTVLLDIYFRDNRKMARSYESPEDDMNIIMEFAKEWKEAGFPTPDNDETNFFD